MNVVDAFTLTIGLDPSKFEKSEEQADHLIQRLKKGAQSSASEIERSAKTVDDGFRKVTNQLTRLFFLFLGANSAQNFIDSTTRAETALGLLSAVLGTSPQQLSAFQQAIEQAGGSSGEVATALGNLNNIVQELNTGLGAQAPPEFFNLGGAAIDLHASTMEQLIQLSAQVKNYRGTEQQKFQQLTRILGSEYVARAVIQGPDAIRTAVAGASSTAITPSQVKAGQDYVSAWAKAQQAVQAYGREVLAQNEGPITKALDNLGAFFEKNKDWLAQKTTDFLALPTQTEKFEDTPAYKMVTKLIEFDKWTKTAILDPLSHMFEGALQGLTTINYTSVVRAAGVLRDDMWAVVRAFWGVVDGFRRVLGVPAASAVTFLGVTGPLHDRGNYAGTPKTTRAPTGSLRGVPRTLPGQPGGGSLTMETVEGPISAARPLPVTLMAMPGQEEETFGGLIGKLVTKGAEAITRVLSGGSHSGPGGSGGGSSGGKGPVGGPIEPAIPYQPGDILKKMGITADQWRAYTEGVATIEHARYNQMGGGGGLYAGRYQFGPREIPGTAGLLGESAPSTGQFLSDPSMQERFMEAYTADHYRELMKEPAFRALSADKQLEILGYAHNQGTGGNTGSGGARGYLRSGVIGRDAFNTPGTAYFDPIRRRLEGLKGTTPVTPPVSDKTDPYAMIPPKGEHGEEQIPRFRQWNADPVGNSEKLLGTVHKDLQAIVRKAQAENPDLHIIVALGKSSVEQEELAKKWGWSQAGGLSHHVRGTVVDLWSVDAQGHVVFDKDKQQKINQAMKKAAESMGLKLRWGGLKSEGGDNNSFRDAPNFELLNPQGGPISRKDVPKPAVQEAAYSAREHTTNHSAQFNIAHLQVHSREGTSAGVSRDIRIALQRELEVNLATG